MRRPPPLRTYSHLADKGQVPSEYQIVSSRLLYHPERGFETNVPLASWYQRHQREGQLRCADWEAFADPRETTYSKYTRLAAHNEQHLDAVAHSIEGTAHDAKLAPAWSAVIERVLPPLRYVWHGFQMMAAYVGQMAPSGRITLVALFQAGDEMRRIHRIAQRMDQLQQRQPDFGADALAQWQEDRAWQPLRKVVEHGLVAYDWGESFAALCLCIKPFCDLLLVEFAALARQHGDYFSSEILGSFAQDARWHRSWAAQLVALLLSEGEPGRAAGNRAVLTAWLNQWLPPARSAARAVASLFGDDQGLASVARAENEVLLWLRGLGLAEAAT